ncbi:MAG: chromosome condensation regulator, partial [Myxococcaceae bacterium]|nr:chromosome condensation regulator [Myxococcaceae bacterium]
MRARVAVATSVAALAWLGVAACGFGVNLDGVFGGPASEGGTSAEGSLDGGTDAPSEAGIPSIPVEQIGMGSNYGCGRRSDGTVMCWGATDIDNELGDGLQIASSTPVLAKDVADAVDVSVGQHHVCIARRTGGVSCWGYNEFRQLGDGTTTNSPTAKDVISLTDVTNVAVGYAHSCALKKDGTVQCWGDNKAGQLGDGTVTPRSQPAPVMGLAGVKQIASSGGTMCALVTSGDVMCWGKNDVGQAGSPPPAAVQVPVKVAGLSGVTMLASGSMSEHFCAVTAVDVRCWGAGGNGQLGNAKSEDGPTPVAALALNDAVGVAAGGRHTCAWRKDGTVSCWGHNAWRQLGLGDTAASDDTSSPLPVNGLT